MNEKVTATCFFKAWMNTVKKREKALKDFWLHNSLYTSYIKGSEDSVISEISKELNLLSYESDYYGLDIILYKKEDLVPGIKPNTYWMHNFRICIEHENNFSSGLYKEVSHLLITNCDLRVLITYPNCDPQKELDYLHSIISANKQSKLISYEENFLIILGYNEGDGLKWEGYIYKDNEWELRYTKSASSVPTILPIATPIPPSLTPQ